MARILVVVCAHVLGRGDLAVATIETPEQSTVPSTLYRGCLDTRSQTLPPLSDSVNRSNKASFCVSIIDS